MLVLSLPHAPKSEVFYVQASSLTLITQSLQTPLALLPQGEDEVVGVLPWQQVSWHLIEVPHGGEKLLLSEQGSGQHIGDFSLTTVGGMLQQGVAERGPWRF